MFISISSEYIIIYDGCEYCVGFYIINIFIGNVECKLYCNDLFIGF